MKNVIFALLLVTSVALAGYGVVSFQMDGQTAHFGQKCGLAKDDVMGKTDGMSKSDEMGKADEFGVGVL